MSESQKILSQIKEAISKDKALFEIISEMVGIMERMDKDNEYDERKEDEQRERCGVLEYEDW